MPPTETRSAAEWRPDPFGRFEERHFFLGRPTSLVRNGDVESFDEVGLLLGPPPPGPPVTRSDLGTAPVPGPPHPVPPELAGQPVDAQVPVGPEAPARPSGTVDHPQGNGHGPVEQPRTNGNGAAPNAIATNGAGPGPVPPVAADPTPAGHVQDPAKPLPPPPPQVPAATPAGVVAPFTAPDPRPTENPNTAAGQPPVVLDTTPAAKVEPAAAADAHRAPPLKVGVLVGVIVAVIVAVLALLAGNGTKAGMTGLSPHPGATASTQAATSVTAGVPGGCPSATPQPVTHFATLWAGDGDRWAVHIWGTVTNTADTPIAVNSVVVQILGSNAAVGTVTATPVAGVALAPHQSASVDTTSTVVSPVEPRPGPVTVSWQWEATRYARCPTP